MLKLKDSIVNFPIKRILITVMFFTFCTPTQIIKIYVYTLTRVLFIYLWFFIYFQDSIHGYVVPLYNQWNTAILCCGGRFELVGITRLVFVCLRYIFCDVNCCLLFVIVMSKQLLIIVFSFTIVNHNSLLRFFFYSLSNGTYNISMDCELLESKIIIFIMGKIHQNFKKWNCREHNIHL